MALGSKKSAAPNGVPFDFSRCIFVMTSWIRERFLIMAN